MSDDVFSDPDGTREEILAATYRCLRDEGYADLTINAIGEEFEKSPSLVYRHYDSKDDLVIACLGYMLERFERQLVDEAITDPRGRLERFIEWASSDDIPAERRQFLSTLVELRTRAVYDEAYRCYFTRSDEVFVRYVSDMIQAGIDQGRFQECEPDGVAETLVTLLHGAMNRRPTHEGEAWLGDVRDELEAYLEARVYSDSTEGASESDENDRSQL
ncbi:TetR/AcrR family transcriptional regulator [Salinadaptatus halalkaliphilus]|uniref:TetR/AcrR family transcriptional regulator n=1 Tax=Salinadaptatus halalkaliphilus TaxID=2419781 RepID=A0A4S3TKJ6_9EURY|nr:TetR/AcrR family transcriptional regulator [Salinadaptatus halalkaliphilus]THE63763.1 TetR/AcrR family transcriptional regulator [Salinadaptatus halalkaliphilus]